MNDTTSIKKQLTLMVVDNSEEFIHEIETHAEMNSHNVGIDLHAMKDATDALNSFSKVTPSVVLADIKTTNSHTLELIESCKKWAVPLVVTSQNTSPALESKLRALGVDMLLHKSEDPDHIEALLHVVSTLAVDKAVLH